MFKFIFVVVEVLFKQAYLLYHKCSDQTLH